MVESLGVAIPYELEPRTHTNSNGMTWIYNIMESVADGVKNGEPACVELSVQYIEDNVMGSTTGYIRERMARRLRRANLNERQKARLSFVFMQQLRHEKLLKEY